VLLPFLGATMSLCEEVAVTLASHAGWIYIFVGAGSPQYLLARVRAESFWLLWDIDVNSTGIRSSLDLGSPLPSTLRGSWITAFEH
jgi:hypothetical protein